MKHILHPSITVARVTAAARRSMFGDKGIGFCVACGRKAKQAFVEPDAVDYPCLYRSCGQRAVYGAEELMIRMVP